MVETNKEKPAAVVIATKRDDTPFLQVHLPTKKKRRRETKNETTLLMRNEFAGSSSSVSTTAAATTSNNTDEPLVIPVAPDQFQWKKQQQQSQAVVRITDDTIPTAASLEFKKETPIDIVDEETAAAVRALQEEASSSTAGGGGRRLPTTGGGGGGSDGRSSRVIASNVNTFTTASEEQQQYQQDLKALPVELEETAEAYQRVPIAEFGAALLRGMGWKDDDEEDSELKKDQTLLSMPTLPRPHRLGLGAIPAAAPPVDSNVVTRRPRRSDQFQRDQAVQRQEEFYRAERQKQIAADRQRTLQNGSYVRLFDSTRARIVQLVGVPGLNQVKVQREGEAAESTVKRNAIDRLLTRPELEAEAFREADVVPAEKHIQNGGTTSRREADNSRERRPRIEETRTSDRDNDDHSRQRRGDRKREDRTKSHEAKGDGGGGDSRDAALVDKQGKSKSHQQQSEHPNVWVIPNIRVRVVTEKLGRRHYKEKGVVVDVTTAGAATVQMSSGTVLDRVPERYLETALPKVGGNVIALRDDDGPHRFAKGRLLERDSRQGVLQVFDDMSCVQLPLDDLAEWCGPLDDDLG